MARLESGWWLSRVGCAGARVWAASTHELVMLFGLLIRRPAYLGARARVQTAAALEPAGPICRGRVGGCSAAIQVSRAASK